ncbi:NmrA family NAD(P)-binding protein [Actinomadura rayongensis]|uniref:NmrA family NAD(P)-binding protein n=1 Tax=Actinomadura rayongensis TaxID=1429076 RepID=A0A6I4WFV8_9ACTN|nr:NmrA family NAD(P)-binding protein [Actinomadura rayongensis]MXQ67833.1 NmrA family NAD(P)-binding protein [Actinomadura rayongensis]
MNRSTIVVHGATGAQGAPVVSRLLAAGHRVRAAVRDTGSARLHPDAEAVFADLSDVPSLTAAYAGADAVVVQLPLDFASGRAVAQAEAVLRALEDAKVPRAVFNAGGPVPAQPVGVPFVDARVRLAARLPETVPSATVIRPAATYMENLNAPWSAARVMAGELAYPLPADLAVPWLALDDLAAAVADLVTAPSPPPLQVVAGPAALTGDQAAAELAAALGRPVRWTTVDAAEYERMLAPHLGGETAAGIAAAYSQPPAGASARPAPDPSTIRVGTTTLREWAARRDWPDR